MKELHLYAIRQTQQNLVYVGHPAHFDFQLRQNRRYCQLHLLPGATGEDRDWETLHRVAYRKRRNDSR
ncbi:hypothetical protein D3C83_190090 [compost metagenome]